MYINSQWANEVKAGAATKTGTLAAQEAAVANYSTSVWFDSNASKIDRRVAAGNWCNQPGGIGARPTANPGAPYQAFI
jgi:cellulase/cellobiase CelA1